MLNLLGFTAGYAVIFGTQYIYEDSLFQWSGPAIENLQAHTSETTYNFWKFYTNIGGGMLQIVYMAFFAIFFSSKDEAVLLAVNMSIEMFFMTTLKIFHF